jgi:hypothetical protein
MASIYCLLRTESQEKAERARSPFLSRSSTNVILPRRGNGEETNASNNKSIVEVCSISVEKNQMPDVSCAITHYRFVGKFMIIAHYICDVIHASELFCLTNFMMFFELRLLVEQLERVDLSMSGTSIKLAFWINVYNSLVMHVSTRNSTLVFVFLNLRQLLPYLCSNHTTPTNNTSMKGPLGLLLSRNVI